MMRGRACAYCRYHFRDKWKAGSKPSEVWHYCGKDHKPILELMYREERRHG